MSEYEVVCFDLDGTLVQGTVFIWNSLHDHFKTDSARRVLARQAFFEGRISYREWFEHDLELLDERGATRQTMEAMFAEKIVPTNGAQTTLDRLKEAGKKIAVLSGSLDLVLTTFFDESLFDVVFLNRIFFDETGRIAGGRHTPFDLDRKAHGIEEITRRLQVPLERCAFVGDNYNDLSAAGIAGLPIAFRPKSDELRRLARVVIDEEDLTLILPHLGVRQADEAGGIEDPTKAGRPVQEKRMVDAQKRHETGP